MLYKDFKEYENIDPENKVEFLFDAVAYNEYINVADVAMQCGANLNYSVRLQLLNMLFSIAAGDGDDPRIWALRRGENFRI